jgi:hypothetical protein
MRRFLAVLALGAVVAACSEQATSPSPRTPAIAANFMNNSDGGGPLIARYEYNNWSFAWFNPQRTIRAFHTTYPLSWDLDAAWDDAACGPTRTTSGMMRVQEISHWDPSHPDPLTRYINNGFVTDVWISLVDMTGVGPCWGGRLMASGWGRVHFNDNDVRNVTGHDSWSLKADGILTTPDGDSLRYNGHIHGVWKATTGNWDYEKLINVH